MFLAHAAFIKGKSEVSSWEGTSQHFLHAIDRSLIGTVDAKAGIPKDSLAPMAATCPASTGIRDLVVVGWKLLMADSR